MVKVRITSQACWHFLVIPGTLGEGDRGIRSSKLASLHTKFGASCVYETLSHHHHPTFPRKREVTKLTKMERG